MTLTKVETVNVVTMKHGRDFAALWFVEDVIQACTKTDIVLWPDDEEGQAACLNMEDAICKRVFEATKDQIAEAFVRIANAVIEGERQRVEEPLVPPRVETVPVVTAEHGQEFAASAYHHLVNSGGFTEALGDTNVMTWPDEGAEEAQMHYHEMANEICGRLYEETNPALAAAFVRIANDVIQIERRR